MEEKRVLVAALAEKIKAFVKEELVGLIIEEGESEFLFKLPAGQKLRVSVKEVAEK